MLMLWIGMGLSPRVIDFGVIGVVLGTVYPSFEEPSV